MIGETPNCLRCRKYHDKDNEKFSCDVYPEGIPDEIIDSERRCEYEDLKE